MSESLLLLLLAYVALAVLAAAALIASSFPILIRAFIVVSTTALYFISYQGWQAVQGWPARIDVPQRFLLHASVVDEPDKTTGSPGTITLWATDLSSGEPADDPRAYNLEYNKELHSNLDDALRNMRNGIIQLGRKTAVAKKPGQPLDFTRIGEQRDKIEIYSLPDPALPEK
ncbi:MAG: hypothetical protein B6D77_17405 [gamma proteobacterium symbiont of Ctena orbiculata]|nr:MAG: hypothetical protein B6D77_17405 [gamma proteobacterium symbiont of Ctena orbiculata]PVV17222.1 MAG: hypothetical protein B6D78_19300 [gamma proteobacterium symbiont of Ctena orbiculata]PVV19009.1 MAG: hypothetical protein B6D79_15520 [gamma proteobacterium symbiont of Ctena orbiculata]